jgi:hypothetical protein
VDTFTTLWNRVQLRVPAAGPDLCQDLIRDKFQQLVERRTWSWLTGVGSFYSPSYANPGTVSVTSGSAVVTGSGTSFTAALLGKQLRVGAIGGSSYPTYSIEQRTSSTSLVLDRAWVGPDLSAQAYMLFQCYFPVPEDFQEFYSVTNTTANYRLNHNATQAEFDSYDPQRSQSGISYALAFYDYTRNTAGSVGSVLQASGSGAQPVSTTADGYSYPQDGIYVIQIATGGASGAATFNWRQETGITSGAGVLTGTSAINLSNGVQVYFPVGTYVLGDVFVIPCRTDRTSGVPRYEMWPRPIDATYVYPYIYMKKLPALTDEDPGLPPFISRRGDVLIEMALTDLALWPGTANQPNPYLNSSVSNIHRNVADKLIYELEKKDDETAIKDLVYSGLPYAGPWRDGSWLQTHAIYPDNY